MIMSALTEIAHLFPWFFPLAVTLFGACIGSFLNVRPNDYVSLD